MGHLPYCSSRPTSTAQNSPTFKGAVKCGISITAGSAPDGRTAGHSTAMGRPTSVELTCSEVKLRSTTVRARADAQANTKEPFICFIFCLIITEAEAVAH